MLSDQQWNELLNGPLYHPMPMFTMLRLTAALRAVVDGTGKAGEQALFDFCKAREERDRWKAQEQWERDNAQ